MPGLRLHIMLVAGVILVAPRADAQDANPNSMTYHAIHNPQSSYYQGPRQGEEGAKQPPEMRPTGYWEKTWGAIAPSPVGGVLGTAIGASSKVDAERQALADCKKKGGRACKVELAYYNQCAVMTLGDKYLGTAHAESIERASEIGIIACKETDTNCTVYYSACTSPIFHNF